MAGLGKFGFTYVGTEFEWTFPDGTTGRYRTISPVTLPYEAFQQALQQQTQLRVEAVTSIRESQRGLEQVNIGAEGAVEEMAKIAEAAKQAERDRTDRGRLLLISLVHEPDSAFIESVNRLWPGQVLDYIEALVEAIRTQASTMVEQEADVPPTLPPPPVD